MAVTMKVITKLIAGMEKERSTMLMVMFMMVYGKMEKEVIGFIEHEKIRIMVDL